MSRQDAEKLHSAAVPEDEAYTLESILAEYGRGGRQPAQNEADTAGIVAEKASVETAESVPPRPKAPEIPEAAEPPAPERARKERKKAKEDTVEFPAVRQEEKRGKKHGKKRVPDPAPAAKAEPVPEPELPPDCVSLKNVMHDTVDAVLAENDDGLLEPPPSVGERLRGLLDRRRTRRVRQQDTEQLWEEPERPAPEPEIEPEPDSDEVFRAEKRRVKHVRRSLTLLTFPVLALVALAVLEDIGYLPAVWWENALLNRGVTGGCLLLAMLFGMDVWRHAVDELRHHHVTAAAGALLLALVVLADCAVSALTGRMESVPFAATTGALLWVEQWALVLAANARREAFQLAVVGGEPPYVASCTEAGVCKQKGRLAGFYHMTDKPDPARRWQWYLLPLLLSAATVLAAVVCLSGQCMERFLWVWSAHLTVALPLSLPLTAALPLSRLQHRLTRGGSALAGYAGAPALSRSRQLVVTENDLFPTGTVAFNGYKVYGEERIRMLSYASGMAQAAHSQLAPLFRQQLAAEGGFSATVDDLRFCEEGGVIGTIRGETVAMGSAYFMRKQKVSLPHDLKLQTGVFLSIDGVLGAIFVIKYQPSRNVDWALRALRRAGLRPVLAVRSGNVTPGLLKRKFGVDCKPIYPDVTTRLALSDVMEQRGSAPNAVIYREGLMPLAESVIGSRRLRSTVRIGMALCYLGAVVGLLLTYYLTSVASYGTLSPLYMLGFLLLWLLPTLLLSGLVKHF